MLVKQITKGSTSQCLNRSEQHSRISLIAPIVIKDGRLNPGAIAGLTCFCS